MATNNSSDHMDQNQGMYKSEYWDTMKAQLDKEMPVRLVQKPYFKRSILAVGIGIGMALGWFIWDTNEAVNVAEEQLTQPIATEKLFPEPEQQNSNPVEINQNNPSISLEESTEPVFSSASNVAESQDDDSPITQNISANDLSALAETEESENTNPELAELSTLEEQMDWNLESVDFETMQSLTIADAQNEIDKKVTSPGVRNYGSHYTPFAAREMQISVLGGLNLSNGYSNTDADGSFSTDFMLGLGIQKQLGFNTSFRFSAIYMERSGHELEQTKQIITYFLDKYVTLENIKTEKLQFLHIPVELRYRLGSRHYFSSGVFVSYLLNARGERRVYYEDSQAEIELETTAAKGYIGGFAPLSYGLSLGYEFAVTPRITSGLRYNYGLNDLSLDQEFKNSSFDRINDFQIWIGIGLMK